MPKVIVTTDAGVVVWRQEDVDANAVRYLQCQGNVNGSSLAAGIRRAVQDAEAIQAGRDPERPSEKAMRLATMKERSFAKEKGCICSPFAYTKREHLPECPAGRELAQRLAVETDPRGEADR